MDRDLCQPVCPRLTSTVVLGDCRPVGTNRQVRGWVPPNVTIVIGRSAPPANGQSKAPARRRSRRGTRETSEALVLNVSYRRRRTQRLPGSGILRPSRSFTRLGRRSRDFHHLERVPASPPPTRASPMRSASSYFRSVLRDGTCAQLALPSLESGFNRESRIVSPSTAQASPVASVSATDRAPVGRLGVKEIGVCSVRPTQIRYRIPIRPVSVVWSHLSKARGMTLSPSWKD